MEQLNKIYCAQSHLRERLSELTENRDFSDIHPAMVSTLNELDKQLTGTEQIYQLLNRKHSFEKCANIVQVLEDDFNQVQLNSRDAGQRDLALLGYIENIQHIFGVAVKRISLGQSKVAPLIEKLTTGDVGSLPGYHLKQILWERLQAKSK